MMDLSKALNRAESAAGDEQADEDLESASRTSPNDKRSKLIQLEEQMTIPRATSSIGGDHHHPVQKEDNDPTTAPSSSSSSSSSLEGGSKGQHVQLGFCLSRRWLLAFFILVSGIACCCAFLIVAVRDEVRSSDEHFHDAAFALGRSIEGAWHDYEIYALWAHESCHRLPSRGVPENEQSLDEILEVCSHEEFLDLYEHIMSIGLDINSLECASRVEHKYRSAVENETATYLQEHGQVNYSGFTYFDETEQVPQDEKDFYYPIIHAEPVDKNGGVIGLDVYHTQRDRDMIDMVTNSRQPTLSGRWKLIQDEDPDVYSVYLVHPGVRTSVRTETPHSVISVVVRVPDLLKWAARNSLHNEAIFLFDATDNEGDPEFMGGVTTSICRGCEEPLTITPVRETELRDVPSLGHGSKYHKCPIDVVDRKWIVAIVPLDDTFKPHLQFIILGGCLIFFAFTMLAIVARCYLERIVKANAVKTQAEAEKASMALQQVQRERHLNEYLAHEVRNPLASAMAALSFVSANTTELVDSEETRTKLLDDVHVVDGSLSYINDLLRSMLDMNKAVNGQIKIDETPTDILRDVLQPSAAILCMRGARVEITTDGPDDLFVETDHLRLKQIVLNLSINSTKFVEKGFIRLRSEIRDGLVRIYVEDSGPGLPPEKRAHLFEAFQESLDLLHQGTGIGLFICRYLSTLMKAKLWLDEEYDSGIDGCPGARFVIDLRKPPLEDASSFIGEEGMEGSETRSTSASSTAIHSKNGATSGTGKQLARRSSFAAPIDLPESLRVLFVDDETILRKLFSRTIHRVAPTWTIDEASNGDSALQIVEKSDYDVIFMDQYMPSIQRPLLGTEVVRQLRAKGVTCIICGLSANDLREDFMDVGATGFLLKPFPCEKARLMTELQRLFDASPVKWHPSNSG